MGNKIFDDETYSENENKFNQEEFSRAKTHTQNIKMNNKKLLHICLLFKMILLEFLLVTGISCANANSKFYESLTPALGLEKNASLKTTVAYYTNLYKRLEAKDYGFARFGESCEVVTFADYEDHLDSAYVILRGTVKKINIFYFLFLTSLKSIKAI